VLVEAHTLRLRGHAAYDTCDYMQAGEADSYAARDPLPAYRARLAAAGHATRLAAIDAELTAFVEACIKASLATPKLEPAGMEAGLFAPASSPLPWKPEPAAPVSLNLAQALNAGLRKILAERPESILLGQDIGKYGGAFKVTDGLLKEFGRPRVLNTPLAESACTGYAIGLAVTGHRPIEEFQFADFSTEAVTQIALNAATFHFRSGAACPMILRLPCGGGLTFG
jgi:2-oxoisovalerate dehydrogenase E1 component